MSNASRGGWAALVLLVAACGDDSASASGSGGGSGSADVASSGAGATGGGTGDAATGSGGSGATGAGSGSTSSAGAGGAASCAQNAAACADAADFGALFTATNGRADGTLLAIVRTTDTQCALYNDDHVVLELTMLGGVQRLVVNVDGVGVATASAPLVGPPFEEGWHPDVELDYPSDLGLHSDAFTQLTLADVEAFLCEHLEVGAPISVFAYSDGSSPSSAHQIHYNDPYPDGAIVVAPTSASPTYLAFRFASQTF